MQKDLEKPSKPRFCPSVLSFRKPLGSKIAGKKVLKHTLRMKRAGDDLFDPAVYSEVQKDNPQAANSAQLLGELCKLPG